MTFDRQPVLDDGVALRLRPLVADDFQGLHQAASDPEVWAGHPATDRWKPQVFRPYFDFLIAHQSLAITDRATGRIIGGSRYYIPPDAPDAIGIGFTFLERAHWGGATNRGVKALMLAHAFAHVDEVWFHIAPTNIRSQKATARLGAVHMRTATLDLSGASAEWMCFRLTPDAWCAVCDGMPIDFVTSRT